MLQYTITPAKLEELIHATNKRWLTTAKKHTGELRGLGRWDKKHGSGYWSGIKDVYMKLQLYKCAYCERKLAMDKHEWDVEHFRPKDGVKDVTAYPSVPGQAPVATGGSSGDVYWWLAFDPLNYVATCKGCNGRKGNYFPIAGARGSDPQRPTDLVEVEKPYLLYPLSTVDVDPGDALTYRGAAVVAASDDPHLNIRARITIAILELDTRDDLLAGRQTAIAGLWDSLQDLAEGQEDTPKYKESFKRVRQKTAHDVAHASCLQAFVRLFFDEPEVAAYQAALCLAGVTNNYIEVGGDPNADDQFLQALIDGRA